MKKTISVLLAIALIASVSCVAFAQDDTKFFEDVPSTHFGYEAIKNLYDANILSGDENNKINPDALVTREEVLKLALAVNGINAESGLSIPYSDASKVSDWAKDIVATAIKHEIIKGYGDGTIKPQNLVTREELTAIMVRALNIESNDNSSKYTDISAERWSATAINAATAFNFISGYDDGTFKPEKNVSRAEVIVFANNVYQFRSIITGTN